MTPHSTMRSSGKHYTIVDLPAVCGDDLARMPWVHRILLENVLRTASADDAAGAR